MPQQCLQCRADARQEYCQLLSRNLRRHAALPPPLLWATD